MEYWNAVIALLKVIRLLIKVTLELWKGILFTREAIPLQTLSVDVILIGTTGMSAAEELCYTLHALPCVRNSLICSDLSATVMYAHF